MNRLKPCSVPKVQDSSQPFKQMENIKFSHGCARVLLPESEMFSTLDLREENLNQVLIHLHPSTEMWKNPATSEWSVGILLLLQTCPLP